MADLIVDSEDCPTAIVRKATIIKDCGTLLLTIINDILDLSKIEAGKFALMRSPFRLDKVVIAVESILVPIALEKGIQLLVQFSGLDCFLVGDATRIQQILLNVVGNAVKFTHEGTVELLVDCNMSKRSSDRDHVICTITVRDTGIGMSADTLSKIYTPFVQADSSNSRTFSGTGLGLSICKHLVELMEGTIEAISDPGIGSEFRIVLPLPPIQQAFDADLIEVQTQFTTLDYFVLFKDIYVLVVDDNIINQELARRSLLKIGVRGVSSADNGRDALAMVQESKFDLILMDCQMPVMDGYQTTRALREYELANGLDRIPVIALTASAFVSDREKCYGAGMDDHISKPFSRECLRDTVLKWITRAPVEPLH